MQRNIGGTSSRYLFVHPAILLLAGTTTQPTVFCLWCNRRAPGEPS
jgi:hypothetical protein